MSYTRLWDWEPRTVSG